MCSSKLAGENWINRVDFNTERWGANGELFQSWQFTEEGKKDVKKERNIGRNLSLQYLPKSRSRLPFMQFGQDSLGHFPTFQCRPYLSFSADKEQLGTNRIFFFFVACGPLMKRICFTLPLSVPAEMDWRRERGGYSRCYPRVTVAVLILGNLIIAANSLRIRSRTNCVCHEHRLMQHSSSASSHSLCPTSIIKTRRDYITQLPATGRVI